MIRQRWMFDDEGNVWPGAEEEWACRLASHMAPDQLRYYAITNLGFVSLEDAGGSTHIRLRKSKVSPVALASLLYYLSERPVQRTVVSVLNTDWEHEILGNAQNLYARLDQLSVEIFEEDNQRFLRQGVDLDNLEPCESHAILYRHWKSRRFEAHNMAELSSDLFDGRFTVVSVRPSSELIIEHAGRGYGVYSNSYLDRARGTRYQDEPDVVYGQWVARAHRRVHRTGEPILEDVDVMIGASRRVRRRACYRRIVLPFTGPLGEAFVVTASTDRRDIDLRQGAA